MYLETYSKDADDICNEIFNDGKDVGVIGIVATREKIRPGTGDMC